MNWGSYLRVHVRSKLENMKKWCINSLLPCSYPLPTCEMIKRKVAECTITYKDRNGNIFVLYFFWEKCWVCMLYKPLNYFCSISDIVFSNTNVSFQNHTHRLSTYSIFWIFSALLISSLMSSFYSSLLRKWSCRFSTCDFQQHSPL